MPVCKKGYQKLVNKMLLADDSLAHSAGDKIHKVTLACHQIIQFAYIYGFVHSEVMMTVISYI